MRTVLDVVILRPANYWPFLEPVLPWTDVFLPNNDEGETITGLRIRGTGALLSSDRREVGDDHVRRSGSRGGLSGRNIRAGRFDVEPVDGTGSGDAFAAGYIHALLEGADVAGCVRTGIGLGASCVRATGATTGVFNASELAEFLKSRHLIGVPCDVLPAIGDGFCLTVVKRRQFHSDASNN